MSKPISFRDELAAALGEIYVDGLRMAGYKGPLTGWDESWPVEHRSWVYERVDDVLVGSASPAWYTSGDGCDCATGDEYHYGYEVQARAKDPITAQTICDGVNLLLSGGTYVVQVPLTEPPAGPFS